MRYSVLLSGFVLVACTTLCRAETAGVSYDGASGITETVAQIMAREKTAAVAQPAFPKRLRPRLRKASTTESQTQLTSQIPALSQPRTVGGSGPLLTQSLGVNFEGENSTEAPFTPPDTMGAAGPTQFLVCVNGRIKLFDKTGAQDAALNATTDNFFSSVRGSASTSDPHVRFDKLSGRWFITIITVKVPNHVLIAVSSGPTITDASSFTFFQFQQDFGTIAGDPDNGGLADYDTPGIDANAIYIGANIFDSTLNNFEGSTVFVVRKSELLTGGTIHVTAFRELSTTTKAGAYTPQGVDNDDPNANEGYFIGIDSISDTTLDVVRISNPTANTPTITTMTVSVPQMRQSLGAVPAMGSTHPLDDNGDARLFAATLKKGTLYTAHTVQVDNAGAFSLSGDRDAARWYQIGNLTGTPTLLQSGTVFDTATTNPRSYFFPTVTASGQGHAILGCTMASSADFASCVVTGRLAGDPSGTLQTPVIAKAGTASYNLEKTGITTQRWGDYSYTCVDPIDDMTIWTIQECCLVKDQYSCYVMQMKAPPPATPLSCSPSTISPNATNVNIVLTGQSSSGSGFYDPGANLPSPAVAYNHLQTVINGANITVNSLTFTDPTHIALNVTTTGATLGAYTVTITNPDGQQVTSGTTLISVVPPIVITGPTATPNTVFARTPIQFTSSASGGLPPLSFAWTFGDGGTATGANPLYTYTKAGSFTATVTVTDSGGQTQSAGVGVQINPVIPLAFVSPPSAVPSTAYVGQKVAFSSSAMGTGTLNFLWNFGDGVTASTANAEHIYNAPGTFTATLSVTDSINATITGSVTVTVIVPFIGSGADSDGDGIADSVDQLLGINPADPSTSPLSNPGAAPLPLTVTKMQIKLNFAKQKSDSITISGKLPVAAGAKFNGQKFVMQVGDFTGLLTLNTKAQGKSPTAQFSARIKAKKGVIAAQTSAFSLKLGHSGFAAQLASSGLINDTVAAKVAVNVSLIFNGALFTKMQSLSYKAKKGISGSAK